MTTKKRSLFKVNTSRLSFRVRNIKEENEKVPTQEVMLDNNDEIQDEKPKKSPRQYVGKKDRKRQKRRIR